MALSLAQQVANLPEDQREEILATLDPNTLSHDWNFWARPEQLAPAGDWNVWGIVAGRGAGKAIASDTPILTPQGFTPISRLVPGDTVYDHWLNPTHVLGVYPQGRRECRKVTFGAGFPIIADLNHLWTVIPNPDTVPGHLLGEDPNWWLRAHAQTLNTTDLRAGMIIPTPDGSFTTITSITYVLPRKHTCITVSAASSLFLAGKSLVPTHNTRSGAEWVREKAMKNPGCRIGMVARTAPDVYKVMLFGASGLMNVCPPSELPVHKVSRSRLEFPNGSIAETFSAEEPDQLRGPAFNYAWADEVAAWDAKKDASGLNAWDNLRIATREGKVPQLIATTTPKRTTFMNELIAENASKPKTVRLSRGSTYDNVGNLSQVYIDQITGLYEGTALAQQELLGLMLEDSDGALWTPEVIEANRLYAPNTPPLPYKVVAVDPSVAESPKDECGIVVVGATAGLPHQRHAYVLEDASLLAAPDVWARRVVEMAVKHRAPVVAEVNQGGALVKMVIHAINPKIPVYTVHARQGKKLRAEPVVLTYQQGRVHHHGIFPELEDQLTTWDPEVTKASPDRLDSNVHALTALLITPPKGLGSPATRITNPAAGRLSSIRSHGRARV